MKRIYVLIVFACVMCANVTAQQSKKTVAVLNFVNAGGVDNNEISIMTDRFNNALFKTGVYKVLEREKMDIILKEQDFKLTDNCNSTECAVEVGKLLSVDIMVAGKIGKFGQLYTIDLRMIDVGTGELLKTASENYEGKKEGLLSVVASIANSIANMADISAAALEQELAKLQEQNKNLEEQKNLKAQQENQKKQEELKAQLAALEQIKKSEKQQQVKTDAEKQKALEEQKRKQELFVRIEEEKKKQAAVISDDMTYLQAITRIGELQSSIESVEQEIDEQKQNAVSLAMDESPRGEFETQQEYNTRLYNNKQKSKQISDEYETLKAQSKKTFTDELTTITSKKYTISLSENELLSVKLGTYNVDGGYFPVTVTEDNVGNSCDIENMVNSKIYVTREDAKKLRENESLLEIKATMLVSSAQKITIEKITLTDVVNYKNYEFSVNMNLGSLKGENISGFFTDPRDGQSYKTIKIGNQIWMAENLNYDAGSETYCYDDKTSNCNKYGKLYTWEAAKRAVPKGWHLPSKSEFEQLLSYLGGEREALYKELTKGECSFNVLFDGYRFFKGNYVDLGSGAYFWSSSKDTTDEAWGLFVGSNYPYPRGALTFESKKANAFSIRCLKD